MGLSLTFFTFRHSVLFSFLIFHLAIGRFISSIQPLCHDHERSALLNFKESLVINQAASSYPSAYPKVASWKLDEKNKDCCSWDGVKCNEDTGHVVELDLSSSCLYAELLELSNSGVLDLSFSDFENFCLELQKPGLVNLAENLTNLKALNLINVDISSTVPHTLANLSSLRHLSLSGCGLQGKIPSSLGNLTKLENLYLSGNVFPDDLPTSIGNLASLKTLGISSFNFSGTLQASLVEISDLTQLQDLQLSSNQLEGSVPSSIFELRNLEALDLSFNNLSGTVDLNMFLLSFKRLEALVLSSNKMSLLTRTTSSTNMQKFKIIGLRSCNLSEFPSFLHNQDQLMSLDLSSNKIAGKIPEWLFSAELGVLVLKSNNFHGEIKEPRTTFYFSKLRIIDLSHNRFGGNLPSKHFDCWNSMKYVNASNLTYMHDTLRPSGYPASTYFGFFDYSLTMSNKGKKLEYEKLSNLITAIILSNNSFVGEIPTSIANLKGLRNLDLSNNNLQGRIPSSLSNLTAIESMDLSSNMLSGNIPQQLSELTSLEFFDVSDNLLTGPIQFDTFGKSSFDGNPGLYEGPLSKKCENSEAAPPEEDPHSESVFAFGWKTVVIGYASGTIIGVILGHIFSTRKYEWLAKTFRLQPKANGRTRRVRGHRQRM
ncbi:Receptor-like protein 43 [Citrus sinensis]|uniref:receptor-like protein 43 n=1 Tax=Citrus sinensis TaxID=2711 RepID=UPI00218F22BA|nr:receptor-like protein 43 [Citrus sinensis]KAH9745282.1 Receptor-like protein 43 [Citrus sinensis]